MILVHTPLEDDRFFRNILFKQGREIQGTTSLVVRKSRKGLEATTGGLKRRSKKQG